jgi:hypothetical protein
MKKFCFAQCSINLVSPNCLILYLLLNSSTLKGLYEAGAVLVRTILHYFEYKINILHIVSLLKNLGVA